MVFLAFSVPYWFLCLFVLSSGPKNKMKLRKVSILLYLRRNPTTSLQHNWLTTKVILIYVSISEFSGFWFHNGLIDRYIIWNVICVTNKGALTTQPYWERIQLIFWMRHQLRVSFLPLLFHILMKFLHASLHFFAASLSVLSSNEKSVKMCKLVMSATLFWRD